LLSNTLRSVKQGEKLLSIGKNIEKNSDSLYLTAKYMKLVR